MSTSKSKAFHHPRQLSFTLPHRCWHRTEAGLWTSRPWTRDDLKSAHSAGGWENGTQDLAPQQQ